MLWGSDKATNPTAASVVHGDDAAQQRQQQQQYEPAASALLGSAQPQVAGDEQLARHRKAPKWSPPATCPQQMQSHKQSAVKCQCLQCYFQA
jgi:hypothetical protein